MLTQTFSEVIEYSWKSCERVNTHTPCVCFPHLLHDIANMKISRHLMTTVLVQVSVKIS